MQIRDIKEKLSLQQVLSHYNLKPDRNNRLCCPFHSDKTPSMQVYHETNTVYCFSSNCKTHGKSLDVIDFIMHKNNIGKHEAINKAKELLNVGKLSDSEIPIAKRIGTSSEVGTKGGQQQNKKLPATFNPIVSKVFSYFVNGLKNAQAKKPKEYLQQRLLNAELLELGYNSGQFHHRGKLSEEDKKACIDAGLLIEYKGYTPNGKEKVYTFGEPTFWGEVVMGVATLAYGTYLYYNLPKGLSYDRPNNYIPAPPNGHGNHNIPNGAKWVVGGVLGYKLYKKWSNTINPQIQTHPVDNTYYHNPPITIYPKKK
jgi:hypothetical protein